MFRKEQGILWQQNEPIANYVLLLIERSFRAMNT